MMLVLNVLIIRLVFMNGKKYLEKSVEELDVSIKILDKLKKNNLLLVKDVWCLKRKDLKDLKFTDSEINQIIIKLQLHGVDLNKRVY